MTPPPAGPLGFLGGSFDPVHAGHLQLARDAARALRLAHVFWVPAGRPWQKGEITPASQRLAMLHLALDADPHASIDDREIRREGESYTVDTLRELRAEHGAHRPLVWILGRDQLRRLDTWRDWGSLLGLAHIACANRAGTPHELPPALEEYLRLHRGRAQDLHLLPGGRIVEFAMTPVECSATDLRAWLGAGAIERARPCLPEQLIPYISAQRIYADTHGR